MIQRMLATRLFSRTQDLRTIPQIVWWWELRRVPYNFIVGVAGIVTCILIVALFMVFPDADKSGGSPLFEVMAILLYGIAANVCYTGGWISEILVKRIWKERAGAIGEISFALGLFFSVALTFLPVIVIFCMALLTTAFHHA